MKTKPHQMKRTKSFTLAVRVFFSALLFLGCNKDQAGLEEINGTIHSDATSPGYAGKITMVNSIFTPQELYVREKASVVWINNDNIVHTVTADDGAFDSGDLQPGTTFTYTFNNKGDYPYHCKYHAEMVGIIKAVVIIK